MKILFNVTSLGNGGAERVVSNLSNYLVKKNHSISIIVNEISNVSYFIDPKIEIYERDTRKNKNPFIRNYRRLKNKLK